MWINKIKLENFRNYDQLSLKLCKNINIFYGDNAQGKTNIIEAIYLNSIGKSFRTNKDNEMIKIDKKYSNIDIEYKKKDREGNIHINLDKKKNVFINKIKIKKLSELLGKVNIVIFNPDDINILKGSPINRRKFLDIMISQLKPKYIHTLNLYHKTIEQRNNYLRQIKDNIMDENLLDIWDEQLAEYAVIVSEYRQLYINKIEEKINKIHSEITDNKEVVDIKYLTECNDREIYINKLKERRKVDIIKGYTTKGIHRDDFKININKMPLDIFGSQGQHRTIVLSLKICELNIIYDEIGEYPILLLDDFMSELDEKRRKNLLEKIKDIQVIITCTDKISIANKEVLIYNVQDGKVINEN